MTNIKFEIILKMFFLKLINMNILLNEKIFTQKFYSINNTLFTVEQVLTFIKIDFKITSLDINNKIFIMYVAI